MNIMLMADRFLPHAGGSRVYYHNVYRRVASEHGDRVTVLTKEVPGWQDFDALEQTDDFRIIRRFRPIVDWKYRQIHTLLLPLAYTAAIVRKVKPDIIHIGDLYPQGFIGLLMKQFLGLPYVVYCHGEEITQMDRCRLEPRLRDLVYQRADRVIAASEFARQNLIRIGISDRNIEKINPGVDTETITPGAPSKELVRRFALAGKRVVLTVGRLVPRKGHAIVMAALAKLVPDVADLRYLIVGTGPEEGSLKALARQLGLVDVVKFAGYIPAEELPDVYRACDLLAMPNYEEVATGDVEGFGMVFLEANAAGKPVVAGSSGGTAESVIDGVTGYRCDPHDVDKLTVVLGTLLKDRRLRECLGTQGYKRVREEFDWSTRAARLRQLSQDILTQRRRGGWRGPAKDHPALELKRTRSAGHTSSTDPS